MSCTNVETLIEGRSKYLASVREPGASDDGSEVDEDGEGGDADVPSEFGHHCGREVLLSDVKDPGGYGCV